LTVTLCILIIVALAGWIYFRRRAKTDVPAGEVVYEDAGPRHLEAPLVSHRYRLTGKPDYLIETREGLVPVELKSAMCARSGPYEARVMQLLAYCVLVEDVRGATVPYGVLQYADTQHKVAYSNTEKASVVALIEEIRASREQPDVHRDHRHRGRCRACGYKTVCGDALK
jgi:CRISPR-associated exonuclease Cas4